MLKCLKCLNFIFFIKMKILKFSLKKAFLAKDLLQLHFIDITILKFTWLSKVMWTIWWMICTYQCIPVICWWFPLIPFTDAVKPAIQPISLHFRLTIQFYPVWSKNPFRDFFPCLNPKLNMHIQKESVVKFQLF